MWNDNDDHGDENNRFQDHTEDQGSDDHDHDEDQDDRNEDGTTGQVVGGASGEREVRTRRGRVVRKPERFTP